MTDDVVVPVVDGVAQGSLLSVLERAPDIVAVPTADSVLNVLSVSSLEDAFEPVRDDWMVFLLEGMSKCVLISPIGGVVDDLVDSWLDDVSNGMFSLSPSCCDCAVLRGDSGSVGLLDTEAAATSCIVDSPSLA